MRTTLVGLVLLALISNSELSWAQTKIENGIVSDLVSQQRVRVLILTRPDPHADPGSGPANPTAYLAGALGSDATNIKRIGSLPITAAEVTRSAIDQLKSDPNVLLVTRDIPMPASLIDSVPEIGGTAVHQKGFHGEGQTVAVLDTGVQSDHPALAGAVTAEACFSTNASTIYQVKSLCPNEFDVSLVSGAAGKCPADVPGCEHGTHVAGIVVGHAMSYQNHDFEGVAPSARVLPIQVFTLFEDPAACNGRPKCVLSFTSDQLRALEYVLRKKDEFKIASVNMSLGSGYHDRPCDQASALTEIIERLRRAGVATVVAAGNENYFDGIAEPACVSSAISVSSMTKSGVIDVSYSNISQFVTIAAPGTEILSSIPGSNYKKMSGTSMAAPHVAAAFALLHQEYPTWTVSQMLARLTSGAPMVEDTRTGVKIPVLELSHAAPSVAGASPGQISSPANAIAQAATVTPISGSFIIQTDRSATDLQSTLSNKCPDLKCDIKSIGENKFKLDVSPKASPNSPVVIDADGVKKLLNGNSSMKVFDNKLSSPF
jgi:subtilisin family serine protease